MDYFIAASIVYTLTSVIVYSAGPYGSLERLRNDYRIKLLGIFDCFLCTSFWVSVSTAIVYGVEIAFVAWALSIIIDKVITIYQVK